MVTFRKQVAAEYARVRREEGYGPKTALAVARHNIRYGSGSKKSLVLPYPGEEPEAIGYPNGWKAEVRVEYDDDSGPPWGHNGEVRWVRRRDEMVKGEVWVGGPKESFAWTPPDDFTPRQVERMADYFRRWLWDQWCYVGLIVRLLDENGEEIEDQACWGFESEPEDYLASEARSWLAHMLVRARRKQKLERVLGFFGV